MNRADRPRYRVGDVEIDPARSAVRRGGIDHALRRQTLLVLLYLIDRRDRVVGKEELREAIWREVAVTDDAIGQCVGDLRRALGDEARTPRLIRTVPKIGYMFIGQVEEAAAAPDAAGGQAAPWRRPSALPASPSVAAEAGDSPDGWTRRFASHRSRWIAAGVSAAALLLAGVIAGPRARIWRADPEKAVVLPQVPGSRRVAVLYFENQSGSTDLAWLRQGLADMFITDLSRLDKIAVLSRPQLDMVLERSSMDAAEPLGLEQALEVASRTGAEAFILGSFASIGASMRIDVKLHDARNGNLLAAEATVVEKPEHLLAQVDVLALKLATRLGVPAAAASGTSTLADVMTDNLEAYRYYVLGLERAKALHSAQAIALFQKAVALDPRFAMAYGRVGYTYALSLSQPGRAKPYLEKAFQLSGRLTAKDRLHIAAWYAIANQDYARAISAFRDITRTYPHETEAYWRLGLLLIAEERFDEARQVLVRGQTIDPENQDLHNALGGLYDLTWRFDDAIALRQRFVSLAPQEPNAHDSLGLSYQGAGRFEEAIEAYRRAISLDPEFEIAVIHLGNAYFQLGRYDAALAQYQRYIEVADFDQERARGYDSIAWVHWRKGQLDRAWAAVRRADAGADTPRSTSIVVALARHDRASADRLYRAMPPRPWASRGTRLSPRLGEFLDGHVALSDGRAAQAIEHFTRAVRHAPVPYHLESLEDCLAEAYLTLGRLDEAVAEYERVLRLSPTMGRARYRLAVALERKGETSRARAEYERVLQLWQNADPDVPEVVAARQRLGAAATLPAATR
jgi:tetratricopeptide (TPR) repeat protein/DNA-binding winged helix-turn-helix (wHTH) protein